MESDQAKLFVGGLSRETSEETLKDHFGSYGVVLMSSISKDRLTNNPRGFGFVCFSDTSSADKALEDTHVILGRTVEVKKAIPRSRQPRNPQQNRSSSRSSGSFESSNIQLRTRKIFVGGLPVNLTEDEFKSYFEKFGRITDVVVMYDNATRRHRGFGFITFDSEESVESVMQKSFHELSGKLVEVKRAVPKDEQNSNDGGYTDNLPGNFPPHTYSPTPTYGVFPGPAHYNGMGSFVYGPGPGLYGGWYPSGGFGGIPYGIAPVAPQAWMFPLGSSFYPSFMGGGGLVTAGYNGIQPSVGGEKSNQVVFGNGGHAPASMKSFPGEEKLDSDSGSSTAASNKKSSKKS